MSRTATVLILAVAGVIALSASACSSGDIAVGSTQQALQKKKDGTPTGNGATCSWDDTVAYDATTGQQTTTPSANGEHKVGDSFKSLDGCNDCTCTAEGIACTVKECGPPAGGCTEEAKVCPDGATVGRTGPNCEFAPCPTGQACTQEAKLCPDGSYVSRTGPSCTFAPCP